MITLKCTKCNATLTMDAAFAGGVCRCRHCGTIQTVPARLREGGGSSGTVSQIARSPSAYERNAAGSGLDELGEIIASSGLSSSRLRQSPAAQSPTGSPTAADPVPQIGPRTAAAGGALSTLPRNMIPIIAGAAAAVVLVAILVGWMIVSGNGGDTIAGVSPGASGATTTGSQFAGLPLAGDVVIYVIDRGAGSQEVFGEMKEATFASIALLRENQRYQIVFWNNGNEKAYPPVGTTTGGPDAVAAAREALEDVYAFGLAEIGPALRTAMMVRPDEVIIVTGKGYLLDDEFVATVSKGIGDSGVRVHTVMVGNEELAGPLPGVAEAHGGEFRAIPAGRLREFARSSGL